MHASVRLALLVTATLAFAVGGAAAQDVERIGDRLLQEVMPEADRFDPAAGDPPVKRAYQGEELIGYVFLTSDLPPQEQGYSGPIQALVGVTTDGVLTGVRVTAYRESLRYEWGDFLGDPFFLEQFTGKDVRESFSVGQDIDGISGVTISVRALARGVRTAARRVALAYIPPPEGPPVSLTEADLVELSWYELQRRGVAVAMSVRQERRNPMQVSLIHVSSEDLARHLLGRRYDSYAESVEEAGGADAIVLYAVGSGGFPRPIRTGWAVEQGGRTIEVPRERVLSLGRPAGALSGHVSLAGALLLDAAEVDIAAPLTFVYDGGRPDLGVFRVDYTSRAALVRVAGAAAPPEAGPASGDAGSALDGAIAAGPPGGATGDADTAATADAAPDTGMVGADVVPGVPAAPEDTALVAASPVPAEDASSPEETFPAAADSVAPPEPTAEAPPATEALLQEEPQDLEEIAAETSAEPGTLTALWSRVRWVALVIAVGCLAFFTKSPVLRWVSLGTTVVVLGFVDGGFLSISHVTGLVWVGLSAIRSDPALALLAVFTVVTLVLWGRMFCGFLCPFGALQDFIDRLVPRRFKRALPRGVHRTAWKAKYVILAVIVGAALVGVQTSLYQYFEPFGTVFFLSRNTLLWGIAGAILAASAVIPRFYCRYACPLGALLAVGSLVSLRRIPRVEQCDYCRVCEQRCPTGAITGPKVHFAECVRCNVCEIQLRQQTGVCRHDMKEIRPRLIQIRRERAERV